MSEPKLDKLLRAMIPDRNSSLQQLFNKALPVVYRNLPEVDQRNEDLFKYLGGFATVLDQIRATLDQRLRDISPLTCQSWLLPYFADLLDVRPLSPDPDGQREEIARAVQWRQRKGTVSVCVEIAEAVGQAPIIGYEGHRSVAVTPRPGYRQPTLRELGEEGFWEPGLNSPSERATRPGTPAVTVDFRKVSRPRRVEETQPTPLTETSRFDDHEISWQHENPPRGLPCHFGGYQDVSMRTVDMRNPNWSVGHHHPKRFRIYTPKPEGFMSDIASAIAADVVHRLMEPSAMDRVPDESWIDGKKGGEDFLYLARPDKITIGGAHSYVRIEERLLSANGDKSDNNARELHIRATLLTLSGPKPTDAEKWDRDRLWPDNEHLSQLITGIQPKTLNADSTSDQQQPIFNLDEWDSHWHHNSFILQWERYFEASENGGTWHTCLRGGNWNIARQQPGEAGLRVEQRDHLRHPLRWPTVTGEIKIQRPVTGELNMFAIEQLTLPGTVTADAEKINLAETGLKKLTLAANSATLTARDCLLYEIRNSGERPVIIELEYCTVNNSITCQELRASDCILLGTLTPTEAPKLKLRYSCTPRLYSSAAGSDWQIHDASVHKNWPELYHQILDRPSESSGSRHLDGDRFGQCGFGALKQSAPSSIRQGAEDGCELGAFHHRHYCGRQDAIEDKLKEFLPVGMLPVLIVDEHWAMPNSKEKL